MDVSWLVFQSTDSQCATPDATRSPSRPVRSNLDASPVSMPSSLRLLQESRVSARQHGHWGAFQLQFNYFLSTCIYIKPSNLNQKNHFHLWLVYSFCFCFLWRMLINGHLLLCSVWLSWSSLLLIGEDLILEDGQILKRFQNSQQIQSNVNIAQSCQN